MCSGCGGEPLQARARSLTLGSVEAGKVLRDTFNVYPPQARAALMVVYKFLNVCLQRSDDKLRRRPN